MTHKPRRIRGFSERCCLWWHHIAGVSSEVCSGDHGVIDEWGWVRMSEGVWEWVRICGCMQNFEKWSTREMKPNTSEHFWCNPTLLCRRCSDLQPRRERDWLTDWERDCFVVSLLHFIYIYNIIPSIFPPFVHFFSLRHSQFNSVWFSSVLACFLLFDSFVMLNSVLFCSIQFNQVLFC